MSQSPFPQEPSIGTQNTECATTYALASANTTNENLNTIKNILSNQAVKSLNDLTGNRLSELTSTVTDLIDSNGETIDRVRRASLYNDWLNSNSDIEFAKVRSIVAARKYYEDAGNDNSFNELYMKPLINEDINKTVGRVNNFLSDISYNFYKVINIYDDASRNKAIVKNMLEIKEDRLFSVIENIQLYEKKYNVDVRKNLYDYERTTVYYNIYNVIKKIYYGILIVYIIFGSFMKKQMYKNKTFYIVAAIYILLPFSLKYIYAGIIFIYEYISNFFTGDKKPLSYNDIIQANNIENIYSAPVPSNIDKNKAIAGYKKFVSNPENVNRLLFY